jgi:hypothetical protein
MIYGTGWFDEYIREFNELLGAGIMGQKYAIVWRAFTDAERVVSLHDTSLDVINHYTVHYAWRNDGSEFKILALDGPGAFNDEEWRYRVATGNWIKPEDYARWSGDVRDYFATDIAQIAGWPKHYRKYHAWETESA